ncbi:NADPH-dependent FMN reductase family protein [Nocardia cyriacigeorgica]|uniref:hypothetical protein n=1 Tax=Nocardia cyriacigeorgica TaxID=135487 RepID=UPI0018F86D69|nr:hypothetical protein [Nocardia cyriacigeorgica]
MSTNTRPQTLGKTTTFRSRARRAPGRLPPGSEGAGPWQDSKAEGFDVVDTFTCRGFDTWLPLRIVGGIQKGHPDDDDLLAARSFAANLRARVEAA